MFIISSPFSLFPLPLILETTRQYNILPPLFRLIFSRRFAVKRDLKHGDGNERFQNGIKSRGVRWPMLFFFPYDLTLSVLPFACTLKSVLPLNADKHLLGVLSGLLGRACLQALSDRVLPRRVGQHRYWRMAIAVSPCSWLCRSETHVLHSICNKARSLCPGCGGRMIQVRYLYGYLYGVINLRRSKHNAQCSEEYTERTRRYVGVVSANEQYENWPSAIYANRFSSIERGYDDMRLEPDI